jgi:hypothetical protein
MSGAPGEIARFIPRVVRFSVLSDDQADSTTGPAPHRRPPSKRDPMGARSYSSNATRLTTTFGEWYAFYKTKQGDAPKRRAQEMISNRCKGWIGGARRQYDVLFLQTSCRSVSTAVRKTAPMQDHRIDATSACDKSAGNGSSSFSLKSEKRAVTDRAYNAGNVTGQVRCGVRFHPDRFRRFVFPWRRIYCRPVPVGRLGLEY